MIRRILPLLMLLALAGCATPLEKASRRGDLVSVKKLVAAGSDLDEQGGRFKNPLTYAVIAGHADVVHFPGRSSARFSAA